MTEEIFEENDNMNQEGDISELISDEEGISADSMDEEVLKEEAEFERDEEKEFSINEEELDKIADTAISLLRNILQYFDLGEVTIDEYEGDEGELILDITGDDLAILIGRHGKTLDALQFLVSAATVRMIGFRYPVIVDVEGYKNRQRQKLEAIARSSANKVANQYRNVKLRPMTPYERRIIHITLRDDDRVETASEGEGSARHVVIFPL